MEGKRRKFLSKSRKTFLILKVRSFSYGLRVIAMTKEKDKDKNERKGDSSGRRSTPIKKKPLPKKPLNPGKGKSELTKSNPAAKEGSKTNSSSKKPTQSRSELKNRPTPRTFAMGKKDNLFQPDRQQASTSKGADKKKSVHVYDRFLIFDFSGTPGRKGYTPIKEVWIFEIFYIISFVYLH